MRYHDGEGWTEQYRNLDERPAAGLADVESTAPAAETPAATAAPEPRKRALPILAVGACGVILFGFGLGGIVSGGLGGQPSAQATSVGASFGTTQAQPTLPMAGPVTTLETWPSTSSAASTPPAPKPPAARHLKPAPVPPPAPKVTASPSPGAPKGRLITPTPNLTGSPVNPPPETDAFDKAYAKVIAGRIVEDVATGDTRFMDRPDLRAATTMGFLSTDMEDLLDCGMPRLGDKATYYATVATLRDFYAKAGDQLPRDVDGALATYTVARQHTAELLTLLNPILGTRYRLPPWSYIPDQPETWNLGLAP